MERSASASDWDLEQAYETRGPRSLKRQNKGKEEPTRLPIKTASGIIQHLVAPPSPGPTFGTDESEGEEETGDEWGRIGAQLPENEEKLEIPEKQRVLEAKEELARIASAVNEDPEENVVYFRAWNGCWR
jgi:nucleolar complex protein 3